MGGPARRVVTDGCAPGASPPERRYAAGPERCLELNALWIERISRAPLRASAVGPRSAAARYLLAVLLAGGVVALTRAIPALLLGAPFLASIGTVLVVGLVAGVGPAVVTLSLTTVGLGVAMPSELQMSAIPLAARLGAYWTVGLMVAAVASAGRWVVERERAIAARERVAAARIARLQSITSALAGCATPREVAEVALAHGLDAAGAVAGRVSLLSEGGDELVVFAARGPSGLISSRPGRVHRDEPRPIWEPLREGGPVFYPDRAAVLAAYPERADEAKSLGCEAWAGLPLRTPRSTLGVLSMSFAAPRSFEDEEDRAFLESLADQCAQAIERTRHAERERARHDELVIERRRLSDVLQQAEAASRAKDEFLAMLSHELRNPLAPIVTALHLMRLRGGDAFPRERAILERQVRQLTNLVDDLLDVSRITQGKVQLQRGVVPLAQVVARAVEMASPLYEQREHALVVKVPPALHVNADEHRLAQVISNLLVNAGKYTPRRGHVRLEAIRSGERIVLSVRDDGIGITQELLGRIFDVFIQGERQSDRAPGGLGLGLTIARSLVHLHGGEVRAESEGPGKGSTFTVELPAAEPEVERIAAPLPVAPAPSAPVARRRVLVVDDNRDAAELLAESLRESGEVRIAHDGPGALAMLSEFTPDVALLDLGLPVMDGFELARRIHAILPAVRLIAVSGYGQDRDRRRSAAAGFVEHLVKPVEFARLRALVAG
jgi:signal transduction histidine kinase